MAAQVLAKSRLRALKRGDLEQLCVELAEDLLRYTTVTPENGPERRVQTAEEASELGLQSLAMTIDPTYDYVGMG